ncbi:MAG: phosphatidylinositol-specific phospholipase C domain-containing protein [Sphingobacteriaceae bacterium]|nr:phosphatidylinositol-specific phospholipase C domain-containing protein [Sphingobacteriaceae bacterium]
MKKINKIMLLGLFALVISGCKKDSIVDAPTNKIGVSSAISAIPSIVQNFNTRSWMQYVSNETSLSALSIPGAHDAGARFDALSDSWILQKVFGSITSGTARCQHYRINEQLDYGVRYLDIRCRNNGSDFRIYHGVVNQNLSFDDVLNASYTFLRNNPTETVLMSIQEENSSTGQNFEDVLLRYISRNPNAWYTKDAIPKMSEARGRIVLVRNFNSSKSTGISNSLRVKQDDYVVRNVNSKWNAISSFLSNTERGYYNGRIAVNCANGYMPTKRKYLWWSTPEIPNIPSVSNPINSYLSSDFSNYRKRNVGVIQTDFISPDLCRNIIKTNF